MDELTLLRNWTVYPYNIFNLFITEDIKRLEQLIDLVDLYLQLISLGYNNDTIIKFTRVFESRYMSCRLIVIDPNDQSIRKEYKIIWK